MVTKTAVIVGFYNQVEIWAIPPLSSQPPDFSVDHYPTHILPPLFTLPFPDDVQVALHYPGRIKWIAMSSWYFGSSHPLYIDMLRQYSEYERVQIMLNLKPDLSAASLHVINTSELTRDSGHAFFEDYRICEDTLVSCWSYWDNYQCGVYTQSTFANFSNAVSHAGLAAMTSPPKLQVGRNYRLYSCPASGRFILLDRNNTVSVLDFFWATMLNICRILGSSDTFLRDAARYHYLFLQLLFYAALWSSQRKQKNIGVPDFSSSFWVSQVI